jgi:uncharacterized oxidoreductase
MSSAGERELPTIGPSELTGFAVELFVAVGVPADDARIVAQSLVGANLRGHDSHGVMRIPQYVGFLERGEYRTSVDLVVEHETPALVACDARWGLGQVQAYRLLDRIMPKARALGIAAGTMRDCGHCGRLGEYAERAAEEGMILQATVNNGGSGQRVAPPGGVEPRLGTNPLCVGVPTDQADAPIVLDFGTSVAAEGKVRVHHINQTPVPDGWLLDHEGHPTNDPAVLYRPPSGSILPMGGQQAYKGFGLALVLDLLASGLSGGRACYPGAPPARGNNVFFLVIDPDRFSGSQTLRKEAGELAAFVRSTPRAAGVESILLPGDPERRTLRTRSEHGIPLEGNHWRMLSELADRLGVIPPGTEIDKPNEG